MRQLDLRDVEALARGLRAGGLVRTVRDAGDVEGLMGRLVAAGRDVTSEAVKGAPGVWADYVQHEKTLRAGPLSARIVDLLSEGSAR